MSGLLAPYSTGIALAASIGATLAVIVGDVPQHIRRVYAVRLIALRALIAALWRQCLALVDYRYRLGQFVWAPVSYAYQDGRRVPDVWLTFQVAERWRENGVNVYRLHRHAWNVLEDELRLFQPVIHVDFSQQSRMTAAA